MHLDEALHAINRPIDPQVIETKHSLRLADSRYEDACNAWTASLSVAERRIKRHIRERLRPHSVSFDGGKGAGIENWKDNRVEPWISGNVFLCAPRENKHQERRFVWRYSGKISINFSFRAETNAVLDEYLDDLLKAAAVVMGPPLPEDRQDPPDTSADGGLAW